MPEPNDTPMHRQTIDKIRDGVLEQLIEALRERRLATVKAWKEVSALKAEARDRKTKERIHRQMELFKKEQERAEKAIDKLEKRALDLRALVLQLGE